MHYGIVECSRSHVRKSTLVLCLDFVGQNVGACFYVNLSCLQTGAPPYSRMAGQCPIFPSFCFYLIPAAVGHYLHLETSEPVQQGDVATLRSRVFKPPYSTDCRFRFYYNMFGATTGVMRVYVVDVDMNGISKQRRLVFARIGQQGFDWEKGEVQVLTNSSFVVRCSHCDIDCSDFQNVAFVFQVEIEGVKGASWTGDIAIDDFSFSPGCAEQGVYCRSL